MLASRFLSKKTTKNAIVKKFEKIFLSFANFYKETLDVVINKTKTTGYLLY
jgi:multidrug efflux pump subunit AcrB